MPTPGAVANRRLLVYLLVAAALVSFLYVSLHRGSHPALPTTFKSSAPNAAVSSKGPAVVVGGSGVGGSGDKTAKTPVAVVGGGGAVNSGGLAEMVGEDTLKGGVISAKLGNETLKAELGRAAWKLFHTTMARFPEIPTVDEQTALSSYIHLFARLYPCGECAGHFQKILKKFPPQVRTRNGAAAWACHVHNEVNLSLKKPVFDCANIGDFYDCGCEKDEEDAKGAKGTGKDTKKDSKKSGGGSSSSSDSKMAEGAKKQQDSKLAPPQDKQSGGGVGGRRDGSEKAMVLEKSGKTAGG